MHVTPHPSRAPVHLTADSHGPIFAAPPGMDFGRAPPCSRRADGSALLPGRIGIGCGLTSLPALHLLKRPDDHPIVGLQPVGDDPQTVRLQAPGGDSAPSQLIFLATTMTYTNFKPWSDPMARSMTSSAGCGWPMGRRTRTNIPGENSRVPLGRFRDS